MSSFEEFKKWQLKREDETACAPITPYEAWQAAMESQWISVDDRLPEEGTIVLIYVKSWGDVLYTGYLNHDDGWHDADGELLLGFNAPTHWANLPQPPKEKL